MSRWVLNTTCTRSTAWLTARLLIGGEKRRADPPPFRRSVTGRRSADPIVLTYPTSALGAFRCRSGRPYPTVWEATFGRGFGGPGADAIGLLVNETPHWSDEPCSNLASPNGQCQGRAREVDRLRIRFLCSKNSFTTVNLACRVTGRGGTLEHAPDDRSIVRDRGRGPSRSGPRDRARCPAAA